MTSFGRRTPPQSWRIDSPAVRPAALGLEAGLPNVRAGAARP